MGLYSKIFGTYSERQIKKQMQQINMTEQLASTYAKLSDAEMAERTLKFKKEIADGKELDAILPDAFALVREAADRVLGKRPFKVQLICGLLLHQGRIAEMKTGEGKTLVAVLPSYLNALTGKGVQESAAKKWDVSMNTSDSLPVLSYTISLARRSRLLTTAI